MELFTGKTQQESGAAIHKEIVSFVGSVKGQDDRIHKIACSALTHAATFGDSTYCTELVQAMPKSSRGESLKTWFVKFGALTWVREGEEQKFRKNEKGKYDLETAYATPFYIKPETVSAPFDLEKLLKMIESVEKRAIQGRKKGTLTMDVVSYNRVTAALGKVAADLAPVAVKNDNVIDMVLQQKTA
jgi:hypothetical protein